jgi:predicted metal-dependent HD superfamily phosphohydrolase
MEDINYKEFFESAWKQMLADFKPSTAHLKRSMEQIIMAYEEPNRVYHDIKHIGRMLKSIEGNEDLANNYIAIQLAVVMHDFVYDSEYMDNEQRSANMAQLVLRYVNVPQDIVDEVKRLILLTENHVVESGDIDGQILLDADLSILGSGTRSYNSYKKGIRKEYSWVDDKTYIDLRKQFLENVAARDPIYQTYAVFDICESKARRNIQLEIEELDEQKEEGEKEEKTQEGGAN